MIDDEERDDAEEQHPPEDDTGDLPPPSTWAGKARQGGAEEPAESPEAESSGLTEDFEGLEAELSAEISDADEQEEPPTEFDFDDEEDEDALDDEFELSGDQEDEESGEIAAAPPAEETDAPADDPGLTREADTLALSDEEEAKERAHAGLAARAEKSSFSHEKTTGAHRAQPKPAPATAGVGGGDGGVGKPPKRRVWWRFLAASFVIVASMATATSVSFLLFLSDIAEGLNDDEISQARQQLESVEGGDPQTILVLGSDKRTGTPGDPGRSDTAMLLRVDPDKNFLSLMSLPRDLEVPIPGYGTDKLNAAYSYGEEQNPGGGGTELAIKTIKGYLGVDINHVVNVDFEGFYEAVNAIDCVYIDVDRKYFHSNEGLFGDQLYAEIDVPAGYSKLCGFRALQYVRYRHGDNDLVRGARQQDFIREARQRIPPRQLLPVFGEGDQLIDIFTKNTSSDINDVPTIIEMLKTFVEIREAPVRQVSIGEITPEGGVEATPDQIDSAVNQFLGNDLDEVPAETSEPAETPPPDEQPSEDKPKGDNKPESKPEPTQDAGLIPAEDSALPLAQSFEKFMKEKKANLPIFYPTAIVSNEAAQVSQEESNRAPVAGPDNKVIYYQYKFVMPFQTAGFLAYYGVSGVNWEDPPILKNPSEERTIDGRDYQLFYEQDSLRLVAWQTSKGSYWVSNTLTGALTEDQMIGVATSTRELGD